VARRLERQGKAALVYDFHGQILSADIMQTLDSFEYARQHIVEQLEGFKTSGKYDRIHLYGASLGNITLGLVADSFGDFDEATMIVAGSNLARSVWEGDRTQAIHRNLAARHVTLPQLDKAWEELAPKTHAAAFEGKPVHLFPSTTDHIIPTQYQGELQVALREAGADVTTDPTRLGHYMACARALFQI
jgi:hypothetical protein